MATRETIKVQSERAVLAAVRLPTSRYDQRDPMAELAALATQAGATVVGTIEQFRDRPEAGTYMGKGKVDELKALCDQLDAALVIFDHDLSPSQVGNIEKTIERKVIDRSELILDIFAGRATTHEAKLQVELAQLEYTYPRLRAMWSHLERIVGGSPTGIGTRGPGEQQLEIDRRIVRKRLGDLRSELAEIQGRKHREVKKRRQDHFTVGLVGYTNAGKSTLFNTLTAGGAYADDRLFATLVSRTRQWDLGGGLTVMLSDTVGFVRDLPHNLVASFKATLEEATHADLLLIVLDVSDPGAELHFETVQQTLDELFDEVARHEPGFTPPERVLLLNKIDRLRDNREVLVWQGRTGPGSPASRSGEGSRPRGADRSAYESHMDRVSETHGMGPADELRSAPESARALSNDAIPISALPSDADPMLPRLGAEALIERVQRAMRGTIEELEITVPLSDSRTIHTIENRGEVLGRRYNGSEVTLTARLGRRQLDQLRSAGAQLKVEPRIEALQAEGLRDESPGQSERSERRPG